MAISKAASKNFETLQRACRNGDLALMECTRLADGKQVPVLCAAHTNADQSVEFTPIAELVADGERNPFELYEPPEGGR